MTFTKQWPMAWSFKLNPANTYVAAASSLVQEDADQYVVATKQKTAYHDDHLEPVDYLFHSTVPVNNQGSALQLDMLLTWKWRLANSSGTAQLYATFNYSLYGPDGCGVPNTATAIVTPDC